MHSAPAPRPDAGAARAVAPARGAAAGAAVEERAARPQPAQPADQLHRARPGSRSPCPGTVARHRWRTSSTTARRSPCCRPTSSPPCRRNAASTSARELPEEQLAELLVERREVHADVTTGGYLPRLRNLAYKAKTVLEETGANNLYLALGSLVWELDGRPLRVAARAHPGDAGRRWRATGAYRLTLDESGLEHAELLPAGEAAPAARPRRPDADRARPTAPARPGGGAGGHARRAGRARAALPGRGDGGPGDPAVREVPAVEGPRRALGATSRRTRWSPTWCTSPPRRSRTRPATPATSSTSTSWPPRCPHRPTPRSCGRSPRPTAGRTFVLEGPPGTGKSQTITNLLTRAVADGQAGAVRRREAGGAGRRRAAAGRGRHGHVRPRPARQGLARLDGAGADPAGAGARGRRRRAGAGDRRRGPRARPAACWPATPTGCTTTNAAGLSLYSARHGGAGRRHRRSSRCRCRAPFVANAPAEVLAHGAARAGAAARHRRPDPPRAAPPVGVRRLPRRSTCPPTQAAAAAVDAAVRAAAGGRASCAGVLRRGADRRRARRAGARCSAGRGDRPRRHRRDVHRALDGGDVGRARRDRGVHRVPPPGPRRRARRTRSTCRWPRSTWPRRPRRRRRWFGPPAPADRRPRPARAVPAARAKVKPKDVPALVEALWRVQTAVQADRRARRLHPGPVRAGGLEPVRRHRPARRARCSGCARAGAAVDGSSPFHVALRKLIVAGLPARRRGGRASSPAARRAPRAARRSAESSADAARRLGRRRRLRAALVDDPAGARRRQLRR